MRFNLDSSEQGGREMLYILFDSKISTLWINKYIDFQRGQEQNKCRGYKTVIQRLNTVYIWIIPSD